MHNGLSLSGNSEGWKSTHLSTDLALIWPRFEMWVENPPIPGKLEISAESQPCINFSKGETSCEDRLVSSKPKRKCTIERAESISQNILLPNQTYQETLWNPWEILFFQLALCPGIGWTCSLWAMVWPWPTALLSSKSCAFGQVQGVGQSHCACAFGLMILDITERPAVHKQASSAAQASLWIKPLLSISSQLALSRWTQPLMAKHCMWATTLLSNSNQLCQFDVDHLLLEDPGFETLKAVIYQKRLEKDQLSRASSKDGLGAIK